MVMDRRSFLKASGVVGATVAASGALVSSGEVSKEKAFAEDGLQEGEEIKYTHCAVDCGGACLLRCHMKDGKLLYVETDNTGSGKYGATQARACLRGRSIRRWLDADERLDYPLKRVEGTKRGDGQYERISWDEALDTIASEIKRVKEKYGNEAIFIAQCTGVEQNFMQNNPFFRLMNLYGGCLTRYGNYSLASITFGAYPYTYGLAKWGTRSFYTLKEDELVVLFGDAVMDMCMSGDGAGYDLNVAMNKEHVKVICIDPRKSEICANAGAEWIPIIPGTDAALVAGIAHELIEKKMVDIDFLHKYCVGYDEETLPKGAPKNSSYYAYIMGTGYDKVEKTPAWASKITRVPEERIKKLAHQIGKAKPCYIAQGYGPQRHANGDTASRAIMLLAQLVGQVGKPGTNSGGRQGNAKLDFLTLPTGTNPIEIQFPSYRWVEAIEDGPSLTAKKDGIKGADRLPQSIKLLINYANNHPANNNGDINHTLEVLKDESKCEFILCYDVKMTPSAKYADIILPDLTCQETYTMSAAGENCNNLAITMGNPLYEPKGERREVYEVCGEIAKRLGIYDEYSDGGKTRQDWRRELYNQMREEYPQLPTYEQMVEQGYYKEPCVESKEDDPFIADPEKNPLDTQTGKIQIYSPELAELAKTWELPEGDVISPIPIYTPGFESAEAETDQYPLQVLAYHCRSHAHTTYANNPVLQTPLAERLWISPIDAEARGISTGDRVRVFNNRGETRIAARVTNRVMPGVVYLPHGMVYTPDENGIDQNGNINVLTSRHVNPVSKGTGMHSAIAQVEKVEA
jgi:Tat-targeted selenate reductase subunit YnfE